MPKTSRISCVRNQLGSVTLEAALILPFFFALVFTAIFFGLILAKQMVLNEALVEAADDAVRMMETGANMSCKSNVASRLPSKLSRWPNFVNVNNAAIRAVGTSIFDDSLPAVVFTASADLDCGVCSFFIPNGRATTSVFVSHSLNSTGCDDLDA